MSSIVTTATVVSGEQNTASSSKSTPKDSPKITITKKSNAEHLQETNDHLADSKLAETFTPAKKSRKHATPKKTNVGVRKLAMKPSPIDLAAAPVNQSVAETSTNIKSDVHDEHISGTKEESVTAPKGDEAVKIAPLKKSRSKSTPGKEKTTPQETGSAGPSNGHETSQTGDRLNDSSKKRKADAEAGEPGSSPKDSVTEDELPQAKRSKRVSSRQRKATPKAAANVNSKRRKDVKAIPSSPRPPPPAPITDEVANKVKQVLSFLEAYRHSRLDRDLMNHHLISIPESSLLSALIRMRAHYQLGQSHHVATSDVKETVVRRFTQAMGSNSDVDWITIDVSKRTAFEEKIQDKIARHGLRETNLLEVELEMFKEDQLKRLGFLDPGKEIAWHADRFLRRFAEIWEKVEVASDITAGVA